VEHLTTNVRGSSYSSVKSVEHFKKHMDRDFDYSFIGLTFDMTLKIDTDESDFEISAVYGSHESTEATNCLMKVATSFPSSRNSKGETQGGVILLLLRPKDPKSYYSTSEPEKEFKIKFDIDYEDIDRNKFHEVKQVKIKRGISPNYYEGTAVRKGILLVKFVNLIKALLAGKKVSTETGIPIPQKSWETHKDEESLRAFKPVIQDFQRHYEREMEELGDDSLRKELKTLDSILTQISNGEKE